MSVNNSLRHSLMSTAMVLSLGLPSLALGQALPATQPAATQPNGQSNGAPQNMAQASQGDDQTKPNATAPTQKVEGGQQPTRLDAVTSTGTRTQERADQLPFTVDVVDQEKIEQRRPQSLDDLLRDIPGVDSGGGPRRGGESPVVRGLDASRLLITIDGARQNFDAGHQGGMFIDPDLLKQVDVLKGGGSMLYGSGALGGVIAMTTKDAKDFLDPGDTAGARFKLGFDSVNKEWLYGTTLFAQPTKGVDLLANLTGRNGKNFRLGDGSTLPDSSEDLLSGLFKIGVQPLQYQNFTLSGMFFNDKGKAPSDAGGTAGLENPLVDRSSKQRQLVFNWQGNDPTTPLFNPNLTLYTVNINVTDDRISAPRHDVSKQTTSGLDFSNTSKTMLGDIPNTLTYGVSYYHESQVGTRDGAPRLSFPKAQGDVAGIFLQDAISLTNTLSLVAGVRYDYYSRSSAVADSQQKDAVSPRIGVNWQALPWLALYANTGWAFRAPALTEMYVAGIHFGGAPGHNNVFIPNPDLKPETSFGYETGMRLKFDNLIDKGDRLRITGAFFDNYYKDFINLVVTVDMFGGGTSTYVNVPRAHIYGAESQIQYDNTYWFAGLGFSAIRGKDEQSHDWIDSMPADKIVGTIGAKLPQWDMLVGWRSEYNFKQHRVVDTTLKTPSYFINGVFASWAPSDGPLRGLRIDAGIDNIFDVAYRRHLEAIDEPGINFGGAISYTIKF